MIAGYKAAFQSFGWVVGYVAGVMTLMAIAEWWDSRCPVEDCS